MADGNFPTLVSKDGNDNAVANPLFVELSDGTSAVGMVSDALKVSVTNGSGASAVNIQDGGNSITVDGSVTVSATNLDIRDLVFASDKVDVSGSTLGANSGVDIGDVTINNGAAGAAVNIQDGGNSITVDGSVSISGSVTVTATALDIRTITKATDSIQVSANSSVNSVSNPIFVAIGSGAITGEVHSFSNSNVTTTDNHDYTVTTAMLVKAVSVASSGACRVDLLTGPVASLVAKWSAIIPKAGGTVHMEFDPPIEVPVTSTGTVRLLRTNREGSAQSIYTTIVGIDA